MSFSSVEFSRTKNFCAIKNIIKEVKRQHTEWEKIMANNISSKSPVFRARKEYTKNLYNLNRSIDLQKEMKAPKMKTI